MSRPRVTLTRRWPREVEQAWSARFELVTNETDEPMDRARLLSALRDSDALCPTVTDVIDAELLSDANVCTRMIANYGVGFNHIAVEAAAAAGITVTNTPDVLTDCTADLAMTLILMLARRAGEGERLLRRGAWDGWRPTQLLGRRVSNCTLGIVGFGRIGQAVAHRAFHGFGMRVLCYSRRPVAASLLAPARVTQCESLVDLLAACDFVSLHCPGGDATEHLMNRAAFSAMRRDACLINTARGGVVDEQALLDALDSGAIAGCGLDVYRHEPQVPQDLLGRENVVLLPHLGSATGETRSAMGERAMHNVAAYFAGESPPDRVAGPAAGAAG